MTTLGWLGSKTSTQTNTESLDPAPSLPGSSLSVYRIIGSCMFTSRAFTVWLQNHLILHLHFQGLHCLITESLDPAPSLSGHSLSVYGIIGSCMFTSRAFIVWLQNHWILHLHFQGQHCLFTESLDPAPSSPGSSLSVYRIIGSCMFTSRAFTVWLQNHWILHLHFQGLHCLFTESLILHLHLQGLHCLFTESLDPAPSIPGPSLSDYRIIGSCTFISRAFTVCLQNHWILYLHFQGLHCLQNHWILHLHLQGLHCLQNHWTLQNVLYST